MSVILMLVLTWSSHAQNPLDYHHLRSQVAIGSRHMCVISKSQVRCWQEGRDNEIQKLLDMPLPVSNPLQVVAGRFFTCVLDSEDVLCNHVYKTWRDQPKLRRAREVAGIENVVCALDKEGMKCWGEDESSEKYVIQGLKSPRLLTAGGYQHPDKSNFRETYMTFCAVDGEDLYCQGYAGKGKIDLGRPLKNPRYLTVGTPRICAVDDLGVVCNKKYNAEADFRPSENIQQVEAGWPSCQLQDSKVTCGYTSNKLAEEVRLPFKPLFIVPGKTWNICAVAADFEMFCWGDRNTNVPWRLPQDIEKIAVSLSTLCALTETNVRCFGDDRRGGLMVPDLKNPYDISGTEAGFCALDNEGMKCWRNDNPRIGTPYVAGLSLPHPAGTKFKFVVVGGWHIYLATEDGQLFAYIPHDAQKLKKLNVPRPSKPIDKLAAANIACVIQGGEVGCAANASPSAEMSYLTDLVDIKLHRDLLCVQRKSGETLCSNYSQSNSSSFPPQYKIVSLAGMPFPQAQTIELGSLCGLWHGEWNCGRNQIKQWPDFKAPMVASTDTSNFCVWDRLDKKMVCSNELHPAGYDYGLHHIPWQEGTVRKKIIGNRFFTLERLPAQLRVLARYSLPARRVFLEELAAFGDRMTESKDARWRLLKFLEPVVTTGDSPFYTGEVVPAYRQAMEDIERDLEAERIKHSPDQIAVALRIMAASLKTIGEFLPAEERATVVNALREISRASIKGHPKEIKAAIDAANAVDLSKFTSPKTDFLILSLRSASEWLKAELGL